MPVKKRFVVFFDGTWQTAENITNIWLMYDALLADEMSYKMSAEKRPIDIHFEKNNLIASNPSDCETVKLYLPGVGNSDDYNKLQQYLNAVTGDGTLNIAQHAVECIEAARIKAGLEPNEISISTLGFSRGCTSATYFMNMMNEKTYAMGSVVFLDRVRSSHLLERVRSWWQTMRLPPANGVLHLMSAHDKRQFPDQAYLPSQIDVLSFYDPVPVWQDPEQEKRVKEYYMAGVHSDVGGNTLNEPQGQDTRRAATYFLLNANFSFDHSYLEQLVKSEQNCAPVQKNVEFDPTKWGGPLLNYLLYHDRIPVVYDQDGYIDQSKFPIVHERVLKRLTMNQKFQNMDLPYDVPFLKESNYIKVVNDDGNLFIMGRSEENPSEWVKQQQSDTPADPLFNFEQARKRAQIEIDDFAELTKQNGFAPPAPKRVQHFPWQDVQVVHNSWFFPARDAIRAMNRVAVTAAQPASAVDDNNAKKESPSSKVNKL